MKKIIALIMVVMMAMLPVLSMAGEQTSLRTISTLEMNADIASALFGEQNGAVIATLINNMTAETIIGSNGGQAQIMIGDKTFMDYTVEYDNDVIYLNGNVLPYALKVDLNELKAAMQGSMGSVGALSLLGSVDLNALMADLATIQVSSANTLGAIKGLYVYMNVDQETATISYVIPADAVCSVINAIVMDIHASTGLSAMVSKYFGIQDFDATVDQFAAQLTAKIAEVLTGNIEFVMDAQSGNMSLMIPIMNSSLNVNYVQADEDGYINLLITAVSADNSVKAIQVRTDGQSVATIGAYECTMGEEGLTVDAAPFEALISWSDAKAAITLYANKAETGKIVVTKLNNGVSISLQAQNQILELTITSDGQGNGTAVLNMNGLEIKVDCTSNENTIKASVYLNGTLLLVVNEMVEQIAATSITVEGKDAAVSVMSLANDQEAMEALQQTVQTNLTMSLQECFQ